MFAAIQWVPGDKITLFTTEGLIQLGGSLVPRRFPVGDVMSFGLSWLHIINNEPIASITSIFSRPLL